MPNPADIMKIMGMKNTFEATHPKFVAFIKNVASRGVSEGDIIDITIHRTDGTATTANMKVTASDVQLVNDLKNIKS